MAAGDTDSSWIPCSYSQWLLDRKTAEHPGNLTGIYESYIDTLNEAHIWSRQRYMFQGPPILGYQFIKFNTKPRSSSGASVRPRPETRWRVVSEVDVWWQLVVGWGIQNQFISRLYNMKLPSKSSGMATGHGTYYSSMFKSWNVASSSPKE